MKPTPGIRDNIVHEIISEKILLKVHAYQPESKETSLGPPPKAGYSVHIRSRNPHESQEANKPDDIDWAKRRQAIEINPTQEDQTHNEASEAFAKAIGTNPPQKTYKRPEALAMIVDGLDESALDDDIKLLKKAIDLCPEDPSLRTLKDRILLGEKFEKYGNYDEAIKCYDVAIELNPQLAIAWESKGRALMLLGRNIEADAAYAKAEELECKSIDLHSTPNVRPP